MDKNSMARPAETYFCCMLKSSNYIIHRADERLNILVCTCMSAYMYVYAGVYMVYVFMVCLYVHEYVYVCMRVLRCT